MLDDGPSIGTDTSIAFDDGRGRLWSRTPRSITAIPPSLADRFAPAELAVFEWTDYWIRHDDATWLHVGDDRNHPVDHGLYRLRFENRLGLARIQPYDAGGPLCPPLWIEVLSRKFPTPAAHL